ncbi:uncharacterized protein N7498_002935 [Penicillium cinerascens]|uniref:Lysine-specific metallo-endopeptidase domain-containing protein n=1 Tax=Penicillium cinerascens TaxID=70096 RepID=A0A9W9TBD1_9EURO|nr:uncharacterized protein N7498_002935 [Penicillium cinerascens]KAJ5216528.1 hypothetical protein N7498_002935 [Penicillium cinerascens]
MMRFLQGLLCAFGLISLASAKGPAWKLDSSCQTSDLNDMVTTAVNSAFSMAVDESDAFNKILSGGDLGPNKDNILDVVKWMFTKDNEEPNNERLAILRTRMNLLAKAKDRKDNEDPDGVTVVIYCGFDRFEARADGQWYDKDLDYVFKKDESFEACKGAQPVVAYTEVPKDRKKPSQVQLCPWFLNWMKSKDTKSLKEAEAKGLFWRAISKGLSKTHMLLTPIDVTSLLDKVILHELTHTRVGGESVDVDGPSFLTVRYGWNRCRKLAQEGSSDPSRQAQVNADSIALCGSAIRYIKEGKRVKKNGDVEDK